MELKVQIPFHQLLELVRSLSNSQKAKLKTELELDVNPGTDLDDYQEMLIHGPVYNEQDIEIIEENRNSIQQWRTNK